MIGELQLWGSGRLGRTLEGGAFVLGLLGITLLAWIALAQFGSYLAVALGTVGLILGLMARTAFLFQQRPSFTSG
jgi:hypothetical protein